MTLVKGSSSYTHLDRNNVTTPGPIDGDERRLGIDLMFSSWPRTSSMGCWGAARTSSRSLTAPRTNSTNRPPPGTAWTLHTLADSWAQTHTRFMYGYQLIGHDVN